MQTQFRRSKMRRLNWVSFVCLQDFSTDSPIKVKTSTRAPKSKNGLVQIIIRLEKSTGEKRVKTSTRAPKSKNGLVQIIIRLEKSTGEKRVNGINRIYDGVEAETRKSQARFQII